ncbi:hypothetical protein CpB0633 [Chlamydia pneumoniae TW-183]|uniref:Uncharacterized protein n=2 Tax=Chlamydia pneumoniae TaxID=83558 RepID=Q9Z7U5_CHLPN|nr:hypothetical protein [Chlamydia pneumoniae]AAD18748.1 CT490 hypothetical protein [Chlamydia pneumoniae CWL029]AAF38021.1 conserved hypothetical protein [Chlamydia pneumoniae AR39]AAP98562.1 hypothetical protein CpB0633 [Chlamydia pneumoniae TW-183]CRI33125.1 Uncharacterized protein BN1224_Wien1_A_06320 [Chlamydia pneumoniae]CRI35988.1 Uncharacterized protein BN1224_CM1_A_06350 [Chlamydia pneumoniae]
MLIRLFLGISLPKGFPLYLEPPLVLATFQGTQFVGTYSEATNPLYIDNLNLNYHYTQELLYKAVPCNYKSIYREIPLIIFPEVLIGSTPTQSTE